ncbi:chorismate mutase [Amaricoccus sp.]|uniref:chorismate mutase n=1 Tax=Amaricoccus sp. TaxID=1872485 RepID=UPI0026056CB4|nr:chorismate mutase [Amaricoccus sp.]HRO12333.1 chorismate mutase [Amaricoccus sp.]
MAELREEIDRIDAELVALVARRIACIDRAVELKRAAGLPARITPRVETVAGNARAAAAAWGIEPAAVEALWRTIIGWSIAREQAALGEAPEDAGRG